MNVPSSGDVGGGRRGVVTDGVVRMEDLSRSDGRRCSGGGGGSSGGRRRGGGRRGVALR